MDDAQRNKTKAPPIYSLIKPETDKIYADNELIPLSYSGISNPQQSIMFKERNLKSNNPKNCFIERFHNPYYELCKEKLASVDTKKATFE